MSIPQKPLIGIIGQGFVGKNIADDFEERGYEVVRYALEEPHTATRDKIQDCDVVLIAVPTPTTPKGFDMSILKQVLLLVGKGKSAVIKSTVTPGSTKKLQEQFPDRFLFFSPEFLSEATAAYDARNPFMVLVGAPFDGPEHMTRAEGLLQLFPQCPYRHVVRSQEAEMVKYAHNCSGYVQIVFTNILYDLAQKFGADWAHIQSALEADPYIPSRYAQPIHKSGRGAGGNCFIKDFAAFTDTYTRVHSDDKQGLAVLRALVEKNNDLLRASDKDLDLLEGVYGTGAL